MNTINRDENNTVRDTGIMYLNIKYILSIKRTRLKRILYKLNTDNIKLNIPNIIIPLNLYYMLYCLYIFLGTHWDYVI